MTSDTPQTINGIPALPAYVADNGTVYVRCPWCEVFHMHGIGRGAKLERPQHWVAHCRRPGSPYYARGYYLANVGRWDPALARDTPVRATPRLERRWRAERAIWERAGGPYMLADVGARAAMPEHTTETGGDDK